MTYDAHRAQFAEMILIATMLTEGIIKAAAIVSGHTAQPYPNEKRCSDSVTLADDLVAALKKPADAKP